MTFVIDEYVKIKEKSKGGETMRYSWKQLAYIFILFLTLTLIVINRSSHFPITEINLTLVVVASYLILFLKYPRNFLLMPLMMGLFLLLAYFWPLILIYGPLILYFSPPYKLIIIFYLLFFMVALFHQLPFYFILFLIFLGLVTAFSSQHIQTMEDKLRAQRIELDELRLKNRKINQHHENLIAQQAYTIHLSQLEERRRIAASLHDLLGHQLSSAIVQIAALEYLLPDQSLNQQLSEVRQVLEEAMTQVRQVIHQEQKQSLDLEADILKLIHDFKKCHINFSYNVDTPPKPAINYLIISIIQEALTNINKHSNASHVQLRLQEFDQQLSLLITDNGNVDQAKVETSSGVGIYNILDRVRKMNGQVHISYEKGFRIFIRMPLER